MGASVGEDDVLGRRLEQMCGDLGRLLLHLGGRLEGRSAVDGDGTAAEGADPHRVIPGVTVEYPDVLEGDPEPVTDYLGPAGLMTLAGRSGADDDRGGPVGVDPNQPAPVERCGKGELGPGEPALGQHGPRGPG